MSDACGANRGTAKARAGRSEGTAKARAGRSAALALSDDVDEVVDTERYPIGEPDSDAVRAVVERARRGLASVGCTVLRDFLTGPARELAARECARVADRAYVGVETVNVYNTVPDDTVAPSHPGRLMVERGNAFVARDQISTAFVVHRLYASSRFRAFIAACFGVRGLHELADPLSGLCLNVVAPGREHPWHFDVNEYTVSMLTQAPESGGEFEYCPNIRSAGQENLAAVRAVLTATASGHRLPLRPGDLQLFRGRYSLHRVTPVRGDTARHCAIFAYSEQPGTVGSPARARQLFGRVCPEHETAAAPADGLLV